MIVVDSSALLAILFGEPDGGTFENVLAGGQRCVMSAVNVHETATVMRIRLGMPAVERLWRLIDATDLEIVPFDRVQVRTAALAFDRYGKGIDPKARLNLADCAAYALAKTLNAPLLFKGEDFAQTDLPPAA